VDPWWIVVLPEMEIRPSRRKSRAVGRCSAMRNIGTIGTMGSKADRSLLDCAKVGFYELVIYLEVSGRLRRV